ncbi:TetR family transcriptional regulator [Beijerinckiaceae bacterium]|nr:TetR family transcriptional regulator [Beijerinckiaceae bacterium]
MIVKGGLRERILDTALDIVEAEGIKSLTQPRIAKALGLRQSHLTYYFPHKADLVVAMLQHAHDRASSAMGPEGGAMDFDAVMGTLKELMFDPHRMSFFLGIVLEATEEPDLQSIVATHMRGLIEMIAPIFGRDADDPHVIAFIDLLRGIGMRMLLEPDLARAGPPDLRKLAATFGLDRLEASRKRK